MKFKDWLNLSEGAVRSKAKDIDISNLSIGRFGPQGTIGQADTPGLAHNALSGFVSGIGQGIGRHLGPVEPLMRLEPLDVFKKDVLYRGHMLPLQLPSTSELPARFKIESSDQTLFKHVVRDWNLIKNKIRESNEVEPNMPGKFNLLRSDADVNEKSRAEAFTIAVIKVILLADNIQYSSMYDLENPKLAKKSIGNGMITVVFAYSREPGSDDEIPQSNSEETK